jgi:hypothetical protein
MAFRQSSFPVLFRSLVMAGCGLVAAVALSADPAEAQAPAQAGMLQCNVAPGVGYLVTSSRSLACRFMPSSGARPEYYVGTINRLGFVIGVSGPGQLAWAVFAPSTALPFDALAGHYAGATAGASFGVGLGGNVLVGGSASTIALQPLSVDAQTGFNLAAGVAELTLEPAPHYRHR